MEVSPQGVNFCVRGRAHHAKGDYQAALADYEKAAQATPGFTLSYLDLAWLLATCPDDTIRNGQKASDYARLAEGVMQDRKNELAIMKAAVHAELKEFALAIWMEEALLKSLPPDSKEAVQSKERLQLYQAHQPFRIQQAISIAGWR